MVLTVVDPRRNPFPTLQFQPTWHCPLLSFFPLAVVRLLLARERGVAAVGLAAVQVQVGVAVRPRRPQPRAAAREDLAAAGGATGKEGRRGAGIDSVLELGSEVA